ncbi:hypothetical protein, partial [uncultured Gammaproteobacteria bacterium]
NLAIMQESGSDELSLFNPKGIYPFPLGIDVSSFNERRKLCQIM